jgi:hypothetical protein
MLKTMVGDNLEDAQLQQLVDRTIMQGDADHDGKLSFAEFSQVRVIQIVCACVLECRRCSLKNLLSISHLCSCIFFFFAFSTTCALLMTR